MKLDNIPTGWYGSFMTKQDARAKLLDAAIKTVRAQGYAATSVDALCREAGVTKGAFFHHFETKDALAVAAANYWSESTGALFEQASYHAPADPLDRVLAYIDFRKELLRGTPAEFTCFAGTTVQETFAASGARMIETISRNRRIVCMPSALRRIVQSPLRDQSPYCNRLAALTKRC